MRTDPDLPIVIFKCVFRIVLLNVRLEYLKLHPQETLIHTITLDDEVVLRKYTISVYFTKGGLGLKKKIRV